MSINAEFVAVSPDELANFIEDPSSIMDLFMPTGGDAFSSLLTGPTRDRLLALSPETIARSVVSSDPRVQEIVAQRIAAMQQMIAMRDPGEAPTGLLGDDGGNGGTATATATPPRRRLSIDKAWHGLHFLLTGDADSTDGDLGPVVIGGTEIGEDEGYGPARYLESGEVAALANALDRAGVEDEIAARYDPARMTELSIYPGGWDVEDEREWLLDAFRKVRAFYRDAATDGAAVVTCFV